MHSLWDYVQCMIQHLNWRHRGEVQEWRRGGLWRHTPAVYNARFPSLPHDPLPLSHPKGYKYFTISALKSVVAAIRVTLKVSHNQQMSSDTRTRKFTWRRKVNISLVTSRFKSDAWRKFYVFYEKNGMLVKILDNANSVSSTMSLWKHVFHNFHEYRLIENPRKYWI